MLEKPMTGITEQFVVDDAAPITPKKKVWGVKHSPSGDFLWKAVVPVVSVLLVAGMSSTALYYVISISTHVKI